MEAGDLVRHLDGEVGVVLEVNWKASFPYKIIFPSTGIDWYVGSAFSEVFSESR